MLRRPQSPARPSSESNKGIQPVIRVGRGGRGGSGGIATGTTWSRAHGKGMYGAGVGRRYHGTGALRASGEVRARVLQARVRQ